MLIFRAIGDWTESAVRVSWTNSTRPIVPNVEDAIENAWRAAKQRPNVQLFDGPMCRLESFTATHSELSLIVSRTSYRVFVGTNMHNPMLGDEFGDVVLANPIGLSASVQSSDGFVLLGRRNENVAYYPGRIHPFAGSAEPAEPLSLFDEVRRELDEELRFESRDIADLRCCALVEDRSLRQPEVIFHCQSTRTRDQIIDQLDKTEHRSAWWAPVEPNAIDSALDDPAPFTPVAIATLLLFGRKAFGRAWFENHAARFTRE
jgi:hypothetical protein